MDQHLFLTSLHPVQDPSGGLLQVLSFELSLGLGEHILNLSISYLGVEELLYLLLGQ